MKLTLKGLALIAAIETGLLPEIERDGVVGYDTDLFNRFWDAFSKSVEKAPQAPFDKKRAYRTGQRTQKAEKHLKPTLPLFLVVLGECNTAQLRNAVRIKKYLNNAGDGFDRKIRRLDVSLLGQVLVHIGKAVVSDRDARDIAVPPQGFVLFLCQHSVCLLSPSFYHPARERTSH